MRWNFRKSIKLCKGARLNLSKKGIGISGGFKGFRVGVGPKGVTRTVSIPGTGIYNRKTTSFSASNNISSSGGGSVPPISNNSASQNGGNGKSPKKLKPYQIGLLVTIGVIFWAIVIGSSVSGNNSSASSMQASSVMSASSIEASSIEASSAETSSAESVAKSSDVSSEIPESSAPQSKATASSKAESPSSAPAKVTQIATSGPLSVVAGSNATLSITGKPNTSYSIMVVYSSGASTAHGLEDKTSDASGKVSWAWKVGPKTKKGTYNITVSGGGQNVVTTITVK